MDNINQKIYASFYFCIGKFGIEWINTFKLVATYVFIYGSYDMHVSET